MNSLVPSGIAELVAESAVPKLLTTVRPVWQAKNLIERVRRLLPVDPSSACQRLFNAAIHDLREKVVIAGIDLAEEAAKQHKLPPVKTSEDVERYPTSKVIDLSYRMGLLSRPGWRRVSRCYEIRRDLEHEDNEYEAGVEDCVYIFQTCISEILSRDPIHLVRVTDIKTLIEEPGPAAPAPSLLEDYEHAPQPRQEEILKFLASVALDGEQSDLVRQNAFAFIGQLSELTQNSVKLELASHLQAKAKQQDRVRTVIRIAAESGTLPYLKQSLVKDYYVAFYRRMESTGYAWQKFKAHGALLRSFKEVRGFKYCPADVRPKILQWLVLAYLGEPGGRTAWGNIRHVYYSNTAARLVEELVGDEMAVVRDDLRGLAESKDIRRVMSTEHIQRRMDQLLDLVEETPKDG